MNVRKLCRELLRLSAIKLKSRTQSKEDDWEVRLEACGEMSRERPT